MQLERYIVSYRIARRGLGSWHMGTRSEVMHECVVCLRVCLYACLFGVFLLLI
jgi:hypothetical protein